MLKGKVLSVREAGHWSTRHDLLCPSPIVTKLPPIALSINISILSGTVSRELSIPLATTELLLISPIVSDLMRLSSLDMTGDTRPWSPTIVLTPFSFASAASSVACCRFEPSGHST